MARLKTREYIDLCNKLNLKIRSGKETDLERIRAMAKILNLEVAIIKLVLEYRNMREEI